MDVNAVVSYNVRMIRVRRGWTQQSVAERLALLTKHLLPQASISAMERAFDGERRRRFDAHELYLLSVVFDVPLMYFFLPPPGAGGERLAHTDRPVTELYSALLGPASNTTVLDERLTDIPEQADEVLSSLVRRGREQLAQRLQELAQSDRGRTDNAYAGRLDGVAESLFEIASLLKSLRPEGYLQGTDTRNT